MVPGPDLTTGMNSINYQRVLTVITAVIGFSAAQIYRWNHGFVRVPSQRTSDVFYLIFMERVKLVEESVELFTGRTKAACHVQLEVDPIWGKFMTQEISVLNPLWHIYLTKDR